MAQIIAYDVKSTIAQYAMKLNARNVTKLRAIISMTQACAKKTVMRQMDRSYILMNSIFNSACIVELSIAKYAT